MALATDSEMTGRPRLPIRARLTLVFAVCLALALAALGVFVFGRTARALLAAEDAGLSSRAEVVAADVRAGASILPHVKATLIEGDEAFAEVVDSTGRVVQSSPNVGFRSMLPTTLLRSVRGPMYIDASVRGIDGTARVLAMPTGSPEGPRIVLVGGSLQDRADSLAQLGWTLTIGGIAALGVLSIIAWLVVGRALSPVDRMREEAAAITASDTARRLSVPPGADEIASLGKTLNQMLDRIDESVARERRLVDRASHELRTPLAVQRMTLDLAATGPQTVAELNAALESVSEENIHLSTIADDLLLVARSLDGELAIRRTRVSLDALVGDARRRNSPRAADAGVALRVSAPHEVVWADPGWLRQAIDNLVQNSLRHTSRGGLVHILAGRTNGTISLVVEDSGPGFPREVLDRAFEPFASSASGGAGKPVGLGLAVVGSIAQAHGGKAWAENRAEGGARVTVELTDGGCPPGADPER